MFSSNPVFLGQKAKRAAIGSRLLSAPYNSFYFSPAEALLPHRAFDPHNALLPHRALLPQSALLPHKAFDPQRALLPQSAFDPHNAFVPVIVADGEPATNCDDPHTCALDQACEVFHTAVELSLR
jgi:hypothetical protein